MKNQVNSGKAQGAEPTKLTVPLITEYLKRDLSGAISCLNAIYTDPDLLTNMAEFMLGRMENARHAEELKRQQAIEDALHATTD